MRKYLKGVTVRDLKKSDRRKCKELNFDYLLKDKAKIFEKDDLYVIMSKSDYECYGKEKLCNVIFIEHSNVLNEDFLRVDFEKIVNDISFNEPRNIEVEFIENIEGTNESIFRNINNSNQYYMRQDNSKKRYAQWYSAFKHQGKWEDNAPIRANITFKMGNETEKVSYSNWNAEGVYSKDYNDAFSYKKLERKDVINKITELSKEYKDKEDIDICDL